MERFGLVQALSWLVDAGRINVHSVYGLAVAERLGAMLPPNEYARRRAAEL